MDFKVKCVLVKQCPESFTEGKIYEVVNGVIVDDRGKQFETWSDPLCGSGRGNNFESFNKWFSKWFEFELVEDKKVFTVDDLKTGMFGVKSLWLLMITLFTRTMDTIMLLLLLIISKVWVMELRRCGLIFGLLEC